MSVKFTHISGASEVSKELTTIISAHLNKGEQVLWLIPGGSAMQVAIDTVVLLRQHEGIERLRVSLTDERYGKPGHKASNWQQLLDKGLMLPKAHLLPVLDGSDLEENAKNYASLLSKEIDKSDYSLALCGIGVDGHIFGIKPGGPAIDGDKFAVGYSGDDYERITPTLTFLKMLDEVCVYAVGPEKHQQLDNLLKNLPPVQQPAQLLKQLKNVTIYNDYMGNLV